MGGMDPLGDIMGTSAGPESYKNKTLIGEETRTSPSVIPGVWNTP